MRRSGAAGGFGGRTAPRMTRNAKARDVLEVILTIVLRCEPTGRDARLGKGERGGFGGSAEVRRPGAETCAHLISEPSQPGGSTARSRRRDRSTRASERGRVGRAGPHLVRFARERANAVTGRDVRSPDVWRRARSSARRARSNERKSSTSSDACGSKIAGDFQWRSSLILMKIKQRCLPKYNTVVLFYSSRRPSPLRVSH